MGGVSALIVSPCVAAPLAGALALPEPDARVWLGGTALFSLAAGMSVPLLLVGASAGTLLPRAGAWMDEVKHLFGVLLLGVALWTVQPVLPASLALALWGAAAARRGRAAASCSTTRRARVGDRRRAGRRQAVAALSAVGVLQIVGAASGGDRPAAAARPHLGEQRRDDAEDAALHAVRSVDELDAALRTAGRPVMLDFYADWCVSCKEMERFTFSDATVQKKARRRAAAEGRRHGEQRRRPRAAQAFQPVRAAGHDLLRRATARKSRRALIGYQNSERFLRPSARQGSEAATRPRRVILRLPVAGWSSLVARWAHNPKVAGSNPALATS